MQWEGSFRVGMICGMLEKAEFESNPVLGIGFSSVDLKKSSDSVRANGGIEPGTSGCLCCHLLDY